jgi:hypothetical protein
MQKIEKRNQDAALSRVGQSEYLTRERRIVVDVLFTTHKYMNLRYPETKGMTVINYKGHFYCYFCSEAWLLRLSASSQLYDTAQITVTGKLGKKTISSTGRRGPWGYETSRVPYLIDLGSPKYGPR